MSNSRKIDRGEGGCPVHRDADGIWQIHEFNAAKTVLRSTDTVQAGLGVEFMDRMPASIRRPVLYRDGPEHREHRRQTAKYFTPRHVDSHYRELMERYADREIAALRRDGSGDLAEISFRFAVDVAKAIVGLTESRPGTDKRLARFFVGRDVAPGFSSPTAVYNLWLQGWWWTSFYVNDVRPAIKVRRHARQDDLISHLIDEDCTNVEILAECLTFASAGMVTTREFISAAAWHLFGDVELRKRFHEGDQAQRYALLHEILRLEPPLDRLKRRTTKTLELPDGSTIPDGEFVHIKTSAVNTDETAVGPEPLEVQPDRAISPGLSFGEGPHKCPGMYVAIQETDIFLTKLFAIDTLDLAAPPKVTHNAVFESYEIRDMAVTVR
ncbi:cytochrome P450 [Actinocrispum sp. NPDC049592]|uniref:cytochrome P450 n=1 Tax=Actinocrispum sp. NPDC049592 TaxID=3154835 RepID=UPI00341D697F